MCDLPIKEYSNIQRDLKEHTKTLLLKYTIPSNGTVFKGRKMR